MLRLLSIAALTAIVSLPASPAQAQTCTGKPGVSGSFTRTLMSGDLERTFYVDVPASYNPRSGAPVIFNFHGLGGSAQGQANGTDMTARAGAEGFIVVHAEGYENSWNGGTCCGTAAVRDIDDVQFVRDMVDALNEEFCVDPARIHSTGFSNGGYFSHRLGCEASDIIASIAPVSGLVGVACDPERVVPVHQSHGTLDPLVWYNAGTQDIAEWAEINGCDAEPTSYYKRANVDCIRYDNCQAGADVELCTLRGVTHTWVDSRFYQTTDANIEFFMDHPMQ